MFEMMRNDVKGNKELEDALEEAIKKDRYYTNAYMSGKIPEEALELVLTAVWKTYRDTVHRHYFKRFMSERGG